ncbi:MAG: DegT/DnrJ/EryC1/StrS family aminotransferase [Nitrospinota bacterium]|nr:DegT/DnrJ/EryC1/StrS family aminotransferase [Nitrospinota bacterium]
MLSRYRPSFGVSEFAAALRIPRTDDVEIFETAFAQKLGHKHAIAFPYGRTGLSLLLEALGIKGKEIICPAYTCVVVPNAIAHSGNSPVFVDCEENGFNMDLDLALEAITENTAAIIATSLFGEPVDLDRLNAIQREHGHIKIIQDCAHAFTAEWKGRPVRKHGVAALYGLSISKPMTSIFGGMVATDDDELARRLRSISRERLKPAPLLKSIRRFFYLLFASFAFIQPVYALLNRLERAGISNPIFTDDDGGETGMPNDFLIAMSPLEARVGMAQLEKLDRIAESCKKLAKIYNEILDGTPFLRLPPATEGSVYSTYAARISPPEPLVEFMEKQGIELGRFIEYSVEELEGFKSCKYIGNKLSQRYSETVLNLPTGPHIDEISARKVCRLIMEFTG